MRRTLTRCITALVVAAAGFAASATADCLTRTPDASAKLRKERMNHSVNFDGEQFLNPVAGECLAVGDGRGRRLSGRWLGSHHRLVCRTRRFGSPRGEFCLGVASILAHIGVGR